MVTLQEEFEIRNDTLSGACRRLASAVMATDCKLKVPVAAMLANVAQTLIGKGSWRTKADAASDVRELLHKEGFAEQPAPNGYPSWYADLCLLMEHSGIYEEPRYNPLQQTGEADSTAPSS